MDCPGYTRHTKQVQICLTLTVTHEHGVIIVREEWPCNLPKITWQESTGLEARCSVSRMLTFNHHTQSLKLLLPLLCWISWSPLELGLWFGSEMLLWVTHEGTRHMQPLTWLNIRLFYEVTYFLFLEGCLSLYRVMESESKPT